MIHDLQSISLDSFLPVGSGKREVSVLRLDLPDPVKGGNKKFKLKYNLEAFKQSGKRRLLTFGGAFSNHIAAVAAAGSEYNISTVGIIRGDELTAEANAVLQFAKESGMELMFVSREEYRWRNDEAYLHQLREEMADIWIIPEGGSNAAAVRGCREILQDIVIPFEHVFLPVGTGGTLAGVASGTDAQVHGIAVLDGRGYLEELVKGICPECSGRSNWRIHHDFTFGGYGKWNSELLSFISTVNQATGIPLDGVYSGKAFFAMIDLLTKGVVNGEKVLFIHTGGYAFSL